MDSFIQDIRIGVRQLLKSKTVTATAALSVAIAIGANTTVFSIVNSMLLRPTPGVTAPERLVEVGRMEAGTDPMDTLSYLTWQDLLDNDVVDLAYWMFAPIAISEESESDVVLGFTTTPSYFSVLGLTPSRGRFFTEEEASASDQAALAVISHALWERRFGLDPSVIGGTIRINGVAATIVGVAPAGFHGHISALSADVWVPLGMLAPGLPGPDTLDGRNNAFLLGVGRLRPGVAIERAQAALETRMAGIVTAHPTLEGQSVAVAPLTSLPAFAQQMVALFMTVLMAVVGVVLLIASVNVASVLLSWGAARNKEIAIRLSVGATRTRLVRQLVTESLLLFGLGGILGVSLARGMASLVMHFQPPLPAPFALALDLTFDNRVLAFSLLTSLVTGLVFGLGPALSSTRSAVSPGLRGDAGVRRSRFRGALVTGQVALTVLLLVVSALFLRALGNAQSMYPGFDAEGVHIMSYDLELVGLDGDDASQFHFELEREVEALPGVESVSLAQMVPLGMPVRHGLGGVNVAGFDPPDDESAFDASSNVVSPGYFETLRIPLSSGRDFDARDDARARDVAIINESMAAYFWPDGNAVGQQFHLGPIEDGETIEVVGVAADAKYATLREETTFFTYLPIAQRSNSRMTLHLRARARTAPPLASVREAVERLAPGLPLMNVVPMKDYMALTYLPQQVAGSVAGFLGLVGLILAAVGMYGLTAFSVSQRRHEIGVRMALGAGLGDTYRFVLRYGLTAPLLGLGVGLLAAVLATRFLERFLYDIRPLDPAALAAAVLALAVVALLANALPARAAGKLAPTKALRQD